MVVSCNPAQLVERKRNREGRRRGAANPLFETRDPSPLLPSSPPFDSLRRVIEDGAGALRGVWDTDFTGRSLPQTMGRRRVLGPQRSTANDRTIDSHVER